jgi:hypothetical protein
VIESVPPTLIGTDGHRVVRRISLPTARLAPGAYEILFAVEDRLAHRTFSARGVRDRGRNAPTPCGQSFSAPS